MELDRPNPLGYNARTLRSAFHAIPPVESTRYEISPLRYDRTLLANLFTSLTLMILFSINEWRASFLRA